MVATRTCILCIISHLLGTIQSQRVLLPTTPQVYSSKNWLSYLVPTDEPRRTLNPLLQIVVQVIARTALAQATNIIIASTMGEIRRPFELAESELFPPPDRSGQLCHWPCIGGRIDVRALGQGQACARNQPIPGSLCVMGGSTDVVFRSPHHLPCISLHSTRLWHSTHRPISSQPYMKTAVCLSWCGQLHACSFSPQSDCIVLPLLLVKMVPLPFLAV